MFFIRVTGTMKGKEGNEEHFTLLMDQKERERESKRKMSGGENGKSGQGR